MIKGTEFSDEYEPIEEGLDRVVETKFISSLNIKMTIKDPKDIIN